MSNVFMPYAFKGMRRSPASRGVGGHLIAPPSTHVSGTSYPWVNPGQEIAPIPEWLSTLLQRPSSNLDSSCWIEVGRRNTEITRQAEKLRQVGIPHSRAWTLMQEFNRRCCKPPLEEAEVAKIVESIFRPEYAPTSLPSILSPLPAFVAGAIVKNAEHRARAKNPPSPLFFFARLIKGHPEFSVCDGHRAATKLDTILSDLYQGADPWAAAFPNACDDPRFEFIRSCNAVRVPGEGSLNLALCEALAHPLKPAREYSPTCTTFLSLAFYLQLSRPTDFIALPVATIAEMLSVDRTTIGQYRKILAENGLLTHTKKYSPHSLADEYRVATEAFDLDTGEQHPWATPNHLRSQILIPAKRWGSGGV